MRLLKGALFLLLGTVLFSPCQKVYAEDVKTPDAIETDGKADEGGEHVFVPSPIAGPQFSEPAGFYQKEFSLELSTDSDEKIYYTLDGSLPAVGGSNTTLYSKPIAIRSNENLAPLSKKDPQLFLKATVVRAIAVDANGQASDPVTATYLVSNDIFQRYRVPVISLSADADSFYGEENGIFENPEESGREWEREAVFEYFTEEGVREICMNVGVRVHGAYSRRYSFKSMRLYARSDYDTQKNFKYDFFSESILPAVSYNDKDETLTKFKHLILRNGGNEGDAWETTYFRDVLAQATMAGTSLDLQAYRPAVVLINGEFYGTMSIRERLDDRYLAGHYNCSEEDVIIYDFAYEKDANGTPIYRADKDPFQVVIYNGEEEEPLFLDTALRFVYENDMSNPQNYAKAAEYFDIDNFIDYLCLELYCGNTDWPHNNCRAWRYKNEATDGYGLDGKIRWLVFDLDFGYGLYGHSKDESILGMMLSDGNVWMKYEDVLSKLLRAFMVNTEFREKFAGRYVDLLNTRFSFRRTNGNIDRLADDFQSNLDEQFTKWGYKQDYKMNVEQVRSYARQRPNALFLSLSRDLKLGSRFSVSITSGELSRGTVKINTEELTAADFENGSFSGTYFSSLPLTITAVPREGYVFDYWEGSDASTAVFTLAAGENNRNLSLVAHFVTEEEYAKKHPETEAPTVSDQENRPAEEDSKKQGQDEPKDTTDGTTIRIQEEKEKNVSGAWRAIAVLIAVIAVAGGGFVVYRKKKH